MKILVTGVKGQLGYDVIRCLKARGIPCFGADLEDFDITDAMGTERFLAEYHPDAVIHCSAYTNVNKAEEEEGICYQVNAIGTRNIAKACRGLDAKMLYVSTDYVFPGTGTGFYEPGDKTAPLNAYGRTKLAGERFVCEELERFFIVRTSWVFGRNGNNFIKTMLRLGMQNKQVRVVGDQIGSPTYTYDLAGLLCDMALSDRYGAYHATNEGVCSWAELAREAFRQAGLDTEVIPVSTGEYPTPAVRPLNSRLSKECLEAAGFHRLPGWQDAVGRYLRELGDNGKG